MVAPGRSSVCQVRKCSAPAKSGDIRQRGCQEVLWQHQQSSNLLKEAIFKRQYPVVCTNNRQHSWLLSIKYNYKFFMFYSLFSNHLFMKVSLKIFNLLLVPQVIEIFSFVRVALTTFLLSINFDHCLSAGILSQINSLLNYIYLRRMFQQSKLNCLWQLLWTNTFSQRIQFLVSRFKFQRARCSISWRAA